MERYACRQHDIPRLLYRVHYPGARVDFSPETGFTARDRTRTFSNGDLVEFAQAITHQFTWNHRDPLPFISLFSDLEHAQNWGCKTPWSANGTTRDRWTLYTINTASLMGTHTFFKLSDIVRMLGVTIPERARQHIEGAFICLHHIPITAIQESRADTEVEQDKESREFREEANAYDYLGECGDEDSDREMMQENWNTIFDKNMEDRW